MTSMRAAPAGAPGKKPDILTVVAEGMKFKNVNELKEKVRSTKERAKFLDGAMKDENLMRYAAEKGLKSEEVSEGLKTLAKTYESKESFLQRSWNWVKRNKWKLIGGAALAAAGVATYYYWPQIAAWGAGAVESVRGWLANWLFPNAPSLGAAPSVPSAPTIPTGPTGLETAPMPRIAVDPGTLLNELGNKP